MAYNFNDSDFFTKLKVGFDKGLKAINVRSKEAYETLRIKNRIQSLNREKSNAQKELGKAVYQSFKLSNGFDEQSIMAMCLSIERIEIRINELREELRFVHINADKALSEPQMLEKPKDDAPPPIL